MAERELAQPFGVSPSTLATGSAVLAATALACIWWARLAFRERALEPVRAGRTVVDVAATLGIAAVGPDGVWQNPCMSSVLDRTPRAADPCAQQELDLGLPPLPHSGPSSRRHRHGEILEQVAEFHRRFELPVSSRPRRVTDPTLVQLRIDLLVEEIGEFTEASASADIVGIADALADIVYVAYGAALTYGIDLDAVIREVHRSNMSKLGPTGSPVRRADGKVLKPSTYSPPDVAGILLDQPPLFTD